MSFNNFFCALNYSRISMTAGQRLREALLLTFVSCLVLTLLAPAIIFILQGVYHLNISAWGEAWWISLLIAPVSLVFIWWAGFTGMLMVHIVGKHLIEIFYLIKGPCKTPGFVKLS